MTAIAKKRIQSRIARHERVRKSVVGTAECPRLAVRRSLSNRLSSSVSRLLNSPSPRALNPWSSTAAVTSITVAFRLSLRELVKAVVHINRCAKTVKGGRRMSFSALVVVGNKNGKVGVGLGKAKEVSEAIRKGTEAAQRNIVEVQLLDGTIPHDIEVKSGSTRILLMPAAPGTGVIAGAAARAVLELAGVRNILTKIHGSSNPSTVVSACLEGLLSQKNKQDCAKLRGFEA